jgi:hypothetical protein
VNEALERCGGQKMRVAMARTQTAVANAFSYEETLQPARSEQSSMRMQPLLVEQAIYGGQRAAIRWSSEYRLLLAVLQDAVACWFRYCRFRNAREQRLFQEIYSWFWEKDQNWLYAFESICEHLDLNADAIRRGLIRWRTLPPDRPASSFQMRRVRRHRKIRPLHSVDFDDEESEF